MPRPWCQSHSLREVPVPGRPQSAVGPRACCLPAWGLGAESPSRPCFVLQLWGQLLSDGCILPSDRLYFWSDDDAGQTASVLFAPPGIAAWLRAAVPLPFLLPVAFCFLRRYMSTLYSHPDFPEKGPEEINEELMKNVSHNPLLLLTPQKVKRYVESLWKKKSSGQPVTFTDIFGMLIGETLIHNVSSGSVAILVPQDMA